MSHCCTTSAGLPALTAPSATSASHCVRADCRMNAAVCGEEGSGQVWEVKARLVVGHPVNSSSLAAGTGHYPCAWVCERSSCHCTSLLAGQCPHLARSPVPDHHLGKLATFQQVAGHGLSHDAQPKPPNSDKRMCWSCGITGCLRHTVMFFAYDVMFTRAQVSHTQNADGLRGSDFSNRRMFLAIHNCLITVRMWCQARMKRSWPFRALHMGHVIVKLAKRLDGASLLVCRGLQGKWHAVRKSAIADRQPADSQVRHK